jgi:hypothetical protein
MDYSGLLTCPQKRGIGLPNQIVQFTHITLNFMTNFSTYALVFQVVSIFRVSDEKFVNIVPLS